MRVAARLAGYVPVKISTRLLLGSLTNSWFPIAVRPSGANIVRSDGLPSFTPFWSSSLAVTFVKLLWPSTPTAAGLLVVGKGLKMSTLHRKRACLNEFAKWGQRKRYWHDNPLNEIPPIRRPEHLPRPFSHEESARLLALELPVDEDLIRALLFYTGLRVTPICTIRRGDLSFDPPQLRATVKGARTQVIRLHADLRDKLYAYVTSRPGLRPGSYLFAYRNGRPFRRRAIERMTARWGALAEVPGCVPHRFRHAFGTALVEQGVDIRVVKEALGHKDLLAHGLHILTLTAAGAGLFPHVIGADLIGFVDVQAKFLKGVYPGDTLYPLLEITALERQRTTGVVRMRATIHNQDNVLVLEGTHAYLLRLPSA